MSLESLKIRSKLAILGLPLLISLGALSLHKVWGLGAEKNHYELSALVVNEVATIGQLVHELQSERGMTVGFWTLAAAKPRAMRSKHSASKPTTFWPKLRYWLRILKALQ